MRCLCCPSTDAQPVRKALNGAPVGVPLCLDCYEAVRRREVGITRDGSVTDGRGRVWRPGELGTPGQLELAL